MYLPAQLFQVYLLNKVHHSLEWLFVPTDLAVEKGSSYVCIQSPGKGKLLFLVVFTALTSGSTTPREMAGNKGQLEKTEEVQSSCCKLGCSEQPTEPDTRLCRMFRGHFSHLLRIGSSDLKCLPNE